MKTAPLLAADTRPQDEGYVLVAAPEVSVPADRARNFRISLDQNVTLRIDGATSGADVVLRVSNTGSFTLTPNPSMVFVNGETTLPLTNSGTTFLRFQYDDGAKAWEVTTPLSRARADGLYLTSAAAAAAYQPLDSDLTLIAGVATQGYGRSLLALTSAASERAGLGLGTAYAANIGGAQADSVELVSPTVAEFNALLGKLRAAGLIAT